MEDIVVTFTRDRKSGFIKKGDFASEFWKSDVSFSQYAFWKLDFISLKKANNSICKELIELQDKNGK